MPQPDLTAAPAPAPGQAPDAIGAAAAPQDAARHFESQLAFETDCWDVDQALKRKQPGVVVLDVRAPNLYAAGHVPGANNLPHARIIERNLQAYPPTPCLSLMSTAGPATAPIGRGCDCRAAA